MRMIVALIVLVGIAVGGCERSPYEREWLFKRLSEQGQ
jgi:hypothetical protein